MQKKHLRSQLRSGRRQLEAQQHRANARAVSRHFCSTPTLLAARRIALYLENDFELATGVLTGRLEAMRKQLFLPVLHPLLSNRLVFQRYTPGQALRLNRYRIAEPVFDPAYCVAPRWLDLILLPLVGFDRHGHRLGMGGGYYDRSLAGVARNSGKRPLLVGLAHSMQEVRRLPAEPWDIRMHGVITEHGYLPSNKHHS